MAYAQDSLGEESDDVVFVSVTIDPARDTVEHLSDWTESRGYNWTHLTAERPYSDGSLLIMERDC